MNKIILDKENNIDLKDNAVILNIEVPELTINISGKVLINEIAIKEQENLKLNINLLENSSLLYNRFIIQNQTINNITINQNNNSNVIFNYSLIALDKCNIDLASNLTGNNNKTEINLKAVTEAKGSCIIKSTADAKPHIENNDLIESIKILNLNNEESVCVPNLLVASNEIEINHACTMSSVDPNYLFYLNGKGISNESAIKLIKNGYLLSNLDINEEIKQEIENIIGGE